MKTLLLFIAATLTVGSCVEKRGISGAIAVAPGHGLQYGYPGLVSSPVFGGLHGLPLEHAVAHGPGAGWPHGHGLLRAITITKEVAVPVPQPYPVHVERKVHVPVHVPYPVAVDKPYPVLYPKPYAVPVETPYPVAVEKPVPYPVPVHVKVPVAVPVKVAVEKPYHVHAHVPDRLENLILGHH